MGVMVTKFSPPSTLRQASSQPRPAASTEPCSRPTASSPDPATDSLELSGKPAEQGWPKGRYHVTPNGVRKVEHFVYDPDIFKSRMNNLTLIGSWDKTGHYSTKWTAVPMHRDKDGTWSADVSLLDNGSHPWQWGVLADSPAGKQQWAIFGEHNLNLDLSKPEAEYAPTRLDYMGATQHGKDIDFRFWAPDARQVDAHVWEGKTQEKIPMKLDPSTGIWSTRVPGGWSRMVNHPYAYDVVTSGGKSVQRVDPYARDDQGQQRGIGQLYLNPGSGQEGSQFTKGDKPFLRFEVQDEARADRVVLRLTDDSGKPVGRKRLIALMGGDQAVSADRTTLAKFHGNGPNDYWSDHIDPDGGIEMVKYGRAWASVLSNPKALAGLHYQFDVYQNGKLVGDTNHDGRLEPQEARKTPFNDPYSSKISPKFGWTRDGIIRDPNIPWHNADVPLQAPNAMNRVIYQLHLGSIFSTHKDIDRSTIKDVIDHVNYFKNLGVTDIELLPTDSADGLRNWGYSGSSTLARDDKYGFVDKNGHWVSGYEAIHKLVDVFRKAGIAVDGDVVYNHWADTYNDMWDIDGKQNPYFNWGNGQLRQTPWGPMPAYNQPQVRQFIVDHAASQEFEDGMHSLRFDFTHGIHDNSGGGDAGWTLLRQVNRELHYFNPKGSTIAEEFPNAPIITTPANDGGAGFDQMWNTQYNHVLIHDNGQPSILQQAANDQHTNMDRFMTQLIDPAGFSNYTHSVTIINDHDEVGNGDRTINVAGGPDKPWARNATRAVFGVGMLSPGTAMFFQGAESMAHNHFTWGIPSTWDVGWDWLNMGKNWDWSKIHMTPSRQQLFLDDKTSKLNPQEQKLATFLADQPADKRQHWLDQVYRKQQYLFSRDAIHLRRSSPAFDGDAPVQRLYTHNDNSVAAFTREKDGQEYMVVLSLNHQNLDNYSIPEATGKWKLVLDSDSQEYGGEGVGRAEVNNAQFDLPRGGMLVYKKVG